jgi:hypothetical protein
MVSRYDLMSESSSTDSYDNQSYPDILSFSYQNFNFTEPPIIFQPTDQLQQKPYVITNSYYGQPYYEDIVLDINNVPHIGMIFNYNQIKFPSSNDLMSFINNKGSI